MKFQQQPGHPGDREGQSLVMVLLSASNFLFGSHCSVNFFELTEMRLTVRVKQAVDKRLCHLYLEGRTGSLPIGSHPYLDSSVFSVSSDSDIRCVLAVLIVLLPPQ